MTDPLLSQTCCIFGHRSIDDTPALRAALEATFRRLIEEERISTFLFGSKSQFDALCHAILTDLRQAYPHIRRVYVRAEYPVIREDYRQYLLRDYEDTFYPDALHGAGRAAYVKRNRFLIDHAACCVVYYDENYAPQTRQSGTALAYRYARSKGKNIHNLFSEHTKSIPPH